MYCETECTYLLGLCSLPCFLYILYSKRKSSCFYWQLLSVNIWYNTVRFYHKDSLKCICVYFLGLNVSLQLLHGDMEQIRKDYMRLFTRNVSITKRLGFSDIIIPGGIIVFCCHYAAFIHHINIEFMFRNVMQIKSADLQHLLSFNHIIW